MTVLLPQSEREGEGQEQRRRGDNLCLDPHLRLRGGREHSLATQRCCTANLASLAPLSLPQLPWGLQRIQKLPTALLLMLKLHEQMVITVE